VKKEKNIMAVSPAEVEKFLRGVDYPAKKADLIKRAQEEQEILPRVIETLKQLPDQTYDSPITVNKAVGEVARRARSST
jgi:DNA anti-recombination protein RmuC